MAAKLIGQDQDQVELEPDMDRALRRRVDRRPYQVGDLVVAAGTHPHLEQHRLMGTVGTVVEVHRVTLGSDTVTLEDDYDYIRVWGDLRYAQVLIGGEMLSMDPGDMRHAG